MRKRVRRLANVKNPPEAWLAGIREYVMSIFKCGAHSIHGPSHWQRVDAFFLNVAESSGADLTSVGKSTYTYDGKKIYGPPTGAIKTFKVEAEGDRLVVFLG